MVSEAVKTAPTPGNGRRYFFIYPVRNKAYRIKPWG